MTKTKKEASLLLALTPIIVLIVLLSLNIKVFGEDGILGPNQMALIFSAAIAGIISIYLGNEWKFIRQTIVKSISHSMPSILILFLIGSLAGTWMISGIVPALIYYGLQVLNPTYFLFASVIISAIVALATGSSWSTIATIGIALLGIGQALGISDGLIAGAIISGAYFGDKMSPLSDTTNLAPAMAGTDLFTHIRYMMYTTVPSLGLTLLIFLFIGLFSNYSETNTNIEGMLHVIDSTFNITPLLFIVPAFLVYIIIKKVPPVPALLAGTLAGGIFAAIFQPEVVKHIANYNADYFSQSYIAIMKSMFGAIEIESGNAAINDLLSTGGMRGMLETIWLILTAMVFSGIMESAGLLMRIANSIVKFAHSTGSLVAATVSTSIFMNITASDQYISIVVPGRMYAKTFKEKGLKPEVLSRTLEDGGTVTSVLVPWNTCGAVQSSVLGVSTFTYAPFAFFSIISPIMTIIFAVFNIKIHRFNENEDIDKNSKEATKTEA